MEDAQTGCGGGPGCQEAIQTLYHFLDGELTDQRRYEIQLHLDECSPCLEAFDFEAELKLVIARKCRDQVPARPRERVRRALLKASGESSGTDTPRNDLGKRSVGDVHERPISRGTRPRRKRAAITGFGKNRVCREPNCATRLSIYNNGKYCYQHEPMAVPRTAGPQDRLRPSPAGRLGTARGKYAVRRAANMGTCG